MDEKRFIEIGAKVMADTSELPVLISIADAWVLISGIQLATRHPQMPDSTKLHLLIIARAFQERIVELHPEAEELLEIGWNEEQPRLKKFNKNTRH